MKTKRAAVISLAALIIVWASASQSLSSSAFYSPTITIAASGAIKANVIKKLLVAWGFQAASPSQHGFLEHMAGFDMLATSVEVASKWDELKRIKELRPSIVVLTYKDMIGMNTAMDDWDEVNQHEDWFLHDVHGERLIHEKWGCYCMNISSQGWRQHYANYVRRMCYDYGYDGVFADDVWSLFWKDPWTVPPEDVTDYPDWHEQMIDFISQVRSRISPKLIIINGPNNGDYVDAADGKMEENFAFKSISGQTPLDNVNALYEISGRGKYYLASPFTLPDDTEENMLFALGCFLLGVNGPRAYFSWRNVWSEPSHGSYPQFDEAEDLGFPVADYYSYQNVWARDFENGWVLVNLSYNPYTVDLEGTYETLEGEVVTEITMEGHTGVILTEI